MQFQVNILYLFLLALSAVALPSVQMACIETPYIMGCGSRLIPRCCTIEEWNELHPEQALPLATTASDDASISTATIVPRAGNMMCGANTIGCGTKLKPRCCTPEEWNSLHPESPVAVPTTLATPTGPPVAIFTGDATLESWPSIVDDVDAAPTSYV